MTDLKALARDTLRSDLFSSEEDARWFAALPRDQRVGWSADVYAEDAHRLALLVCAVLDLPDAPK